MRCVITSFDEFTGKKNDVDYVKLCFLSSTGKAGEIITTREKFGAFMVDPTTTLTKDDLDEIFSKYKSVEIYFDQRGYLDSISSS